MARAVSPLIGPNSLFAISPSSDASRPRARVVSLLPKLFHQRMSSNHSSSRCIHSPFALQLVLLLLSRGLRLRVSALAAALGPETHPFNRSAVVSPTLSKRNVDGTSVDLVGERGSAVVPLNHQSLGRDGVLGLQDRKVVLCPSLDALWLVLVFASSNGWECVATVLSSGGTCRALIPL